MAETGHRYVSRPAPVREDRRFVAGRGRFVADISPPGVLHVALVASPHAHAHIEGIGAQSALELDGVVDVVTGAELAGETDPLRQYLDQIRPPSTPLPRSRAGAQRRWPPTQD